VFIDSDDRTDGGVGMGGVLLWENAVLHKWENLTVG